LQKEGVTQEMKRMEEKIQNDKRKWEEERERVKSEQADQESQLERERRENERLLGSISGLEERIVLLEKKLHQAQAEKETMTTDFAEQQGGLMRPTSVQHNTLMC
jgi:chromosome segregation ATPase